MEHPSHPDTDILVPPRTGVPCCPPLKAEETCDALDFHYRLVHIVTSETGRRVPVEVLIHVRLERCSGALALGDLVYSTTLFPGEEVRLFTMDRRTRFSFDSSTSLSYRHEQTSEEQYYMSSMSDFMSDVSIRDERQSSNQNKGSFETKGKTSGALQSFFGGASLTVKGSYDAQSTSSFLRELNQHVEASHNRSVQATRTANAVSVGEVQRRSHAEGETEDHFEASSRTFRNPNHCHAQTYFFYQINKKQTIRVRLVSIRRRVIDPGADTKVAPNPFTTQGHIDVIPDAVLATDAARLEKEEIGRRSAARQVGNPLRLGQVEGATDARFAFATTGFATAATAQAPAFSVAERQEALKAADADLASAGLIDRRTRDVSEEVRQEFSFEITTYLPTAGLYVRGCLDDCNVCEPALQREIHLDLERKRLENELLKRRIELLDRSQEYRCCPGQDESDGEDEG